MVEKPAVVPITGRLVSTSTASARLMTRRLSLQLSQLEAAGIRPTFLWTCS